MVAESIEEGRNTRSEGKDKGVDMAAPKEEAAAASATLAGDDSKVEAAKEAPAAKPAAAVEAAEGSDKPAAKD